ncbi:hypothetical protein VSN93_15895 [Acinetobacter johnsonii]|uniref:hypothetical protein n=1 Tax=Acinetobacter johnsonii TaxID=40214 RepID=UPI003D1714D3
MPHHSLLNITPFNTISPKYKADLPSMLQWHVGNGLLPILNTIGLSLSNAMLKLTF